MIDKKMRNNLLLILGLLLISSCSKNTPKIVYNEDDKVNTSETVKDTLKYQIGDLPIKIDSLDYLIHPIGEIADSQNNNKITYSYGADNYTTFQLATERGDEIFGQMKNLLFENIENGETTLLTDENVEIQKANYLRDVAELSGKNHITYEVIDSDTNNDHTLDNNDILSLYLSNGDGAGFRKLTKKNSNLIDYKTIPELNRLYFKSVSDSNNNGVFDREDEIIYQFIVLGINKIIEYNPSN